MQMDMRRQTRNFKTINLHLRNLERKQKRQGLSIKEMKMKKDLQGKKNKIYQDVLRTYNLDLNFYSNRVIASGDTLKVS